MLWGIIIYSSDECLLSNATLCRLFVFIYNIGYNIYTTWRLENVGSTRVLHSKKLSSSQLGDTLKSVFEISFIGAVYPLYTTTFNTVA